MGENYVWTNFLGTLKSKGIFKILILSFLYLGYTVSDSYSQCGFSGGNGYNWYNTGLIVTPSSTSQATPSYYAGGYFLMNVISGKTYNINTCGEASYDTQLSIYNNSNGVGIAYNDDACSTQSSITFVAGFSGQVRVVFTEYNCVGYRNTNQTPFSAIEYSEVIIDSDGDGVQDSNDVCNGFDDTLDNDGDGIPNGCDLDDDNDGILDIDELGVCATNNSTLNWDNEYVEGGSGDATLGEDPVEANPNLTINGTEIKLRRDGGGLSTQEYRINDFNTTNSSYTLYQKAENNGESRHIFEFSEPVYNLGFTIYDVDEGGGNTTFIDEVELILTKADGTTHALSSSEYTLDGQTFTSNAFRGEGTSTDKDVVINGVQAWIIKLEIVYRNLTTSPASTQYQGTGLSNFTFCNSQRDTDNDNIPDYLDTDSDGDGCFDAIEGDENVFSSHLNPDGSINIAVNGGVDTNGVPILVNSGSADIGGDQGQGNTTAVVTSAQIVINTDLAVNTPLCAGETANFTFTATGIDGSGIGWTYQLQKQNGSNWDSIGSSGTLVNNTSETKTVTITNVQVSGSGTYRVLFTHPNNSCEQVSQSVSLTVNELPTPIDTPLTICPSETSTDLTVNDSTVLDGETGTVTWYDGEPGNGGTAIASPTTANLNTITDLWAQVSLSSNGCTANVDITTNNDTTDPTASNPAAVNVQCSSDVPAADITVVTDEADNCGTPTVAHVSDVSDGGSNPEVITRTYSVTDAAGNSINVTQTITVNDTTDPTASNPAAVNVQCSSDVPAADITVVTDEADNCGTPTVAHVSDVSDGGSNPEVITRTYSVTDAAGNSINVTQTITVNDTTDPVADTATLSAVTAECEVTSLTAPTATDNCVGSVTGTHDASLPIMTQGTTVVTWTYDDGNGNTSTQTQNVIIQSVTKADAGTNGTLTICEGTTVTETQLFAELGGTPDTGGTWSPALAGAGTYIYTVAATSSCTSEARSEVVVTEEAVPSIPSISVERATCSTPGRAIITNYDSSLTYVFNESTLAVDENGVINGYNFGVTYTVSVSSSCGRGTSEDFVINGRLSGEDCVDTDNDGIPDAIDVDDDNDGIPDVEEGDGLVDTDNDGIPDSLDLDSDNDGINDVIEGGDGDLDTNGDGVIDSNDSGYTDANGDGQADDSVDNNEEPDTDGDGIPDYQDLDSDDDGINDVVEGGNSDEDGDGQVDNPSEDTDGDGIADSVDGLDGHGDANSPDNNTDPTDPNSGGNGVVGDSGIDSDGDGIADSVDGLDGFGDAIEEDTCVKVNNLMSPNGDSANSYLHIDCIENFPSNTIEIFNRWGNTVYRAKGYNNSSIVFRGISEGRANINVGDKLPVGTYFYILDLGNGSKVKKGWIYINR
ncbi:T9SS type B sorting domain-containing protein [Tenacibaculum singaporense]|uniref:T9SS type B sorting domain-containing protein n=1 Tax=Tenacibaculum singaporense TaxID=2358479 RepID=UPI000F67E83E|nr:gliding motility-associated C-terminal domain-containing protein [Tenacibaculum singaporense]RSC93801.1 hypothetical protein EI424_07295 [Tenacibaculum singaporense]